MRQQVSSIKKLAVFKCTNSAKGIEHRVKIEAQSKLLGLRVVEG
jgi:hypothetical protein